MDSNFQGQGTSNSTFNSAVRGCEKDIRAYFTPARQRLQSVLELSRALVAILRGDNSLARYFHVPFASDSIAEKIESLFGELRVLKDENGELDNDICWIDVLLAPNYEPTPQEDGSLHLRLDGRKGLIKMSASDHGLIKTGIPQQLLNPRTYESDVRAERETMRLVEQELALINEAASQSQCSLFHRYLGCVMADILSPAQTQSLTRTMMDFQGWEKGLRLSSNLKMGQITLRKLNQPTRSGRTHKLMRSAKLLPALPS
jgi:hypothetical protein